ncbi:VOC family protein [Neobacillus notoginsengisoli]|nr:VOC family protein [Neobacillus notoginsengisoli]
MKFKNPHIIYYVENLDESRNFYKRLGFKVSFTANVRGKAVHHELLLDGFNLGIATKETAKEEHGLTPGRNAGCELVLWVDDTDLAIEYVIENGATLLSPPHNFLDNKLRSGWVQDLDGNPIQLVSKNSN